MAKMMRTSVTSLIAGCAAAAFCLCAGGGDATCQSTPKETMGATAVAGVGGEEGISSRQSADRPGVPADTLRGAAQPVERGPTWELDRIAAIVNNSVILQSEVEEQAFLFARQQGISLADSTALAAARREVLERLIEEKVIVSEARKRGMSVTRDDVETAVDGVILDMKRATGTEEAFRRELDREGLTEEELREIYRPRLEAQLLASRLVRREVSAEGEVTDADVEKYYEDNKGKFPERPETVRLSHIYISIMPDSVTYERSRQQAEEIRVELLAGEDFASLAREHSADPSAARGGDLGYFVRGQLDPFFDEAVFSLKPGEIGEVVQSRLGFHVIKLTDLKGDTARASHILIPVAPTAEDMERALAEATRVKEALDMGQDFAELAKAESDDLETRDLGGDLGYFPLNDLAAGVRDAAKGLSPGEMTDVVQAPDGYHIFLLTEHRPKGRYTLEETKEEIREFIRGDKLQQKYQSWIEDLKKDAYIDIKGS